MKLISVAVGVLLLADPSFAACRHALVLGLDVSGSVDAQEYQLQIEGVAAALESDGVTQILFDGVSAPVHLAVFEWSGPTEQRDILPWTALPNAEARTHVVNAIRSHTRMEGSQSTAIGSAMAHGLSLLENKKDCWRRTLDLSGDGENNAGLPPEAIDTDDPSIIINGLVIGSGELDAGDHRFADIKALSSYYRSRVIRGPDAFVETALGYEAYADAMTRKLKRELRSIAVSQRASDAQ